MMIHSRSIATASYFRRKRGQMGGNIMSYPTTPALISCLVALNIPVTMCVCEEEEEKSELNTNLNFCISQNIY